MFVAFVAMGLVKALEGMKMSSKKHPLIGRVIVGVRVSKIPGMEGHDEQTSIELVLDNGTFLIPVVDESCDCYAAIMQASPDGDGMVFHDRIV